MNDILAWARPRRWSILNEAALAALLAIIGVPIIASSGDTDPADVVTAYLEALREGDIDTARDYIREPDSAASADKSWLTADAVSSDWTIESVEQRTHSTTSVYATIAAGDQSLEAVFYMEQTGDEFRISNPYAYLSVSTLGGYGDALPVAELELGGHADIPEVSSESGSASIALFPGAYTIGQSNALLSEPTPAVLLAMPQDSMPFTPSLEHLLAEAMVGNSAVEEQLNADLAAWIDLCVQNAEPAPEGCPFSASDDYSELTDGYSEYTDPRDLTWEVDTYPRVRFATNATVGTAYHLEVVEPGWVGMTAKAYDLYEEKDRQVAARCPITLDGLVPVLLPSGRFEFEYGQVPWSACRPA